MSGATRPQKRKDSYPNVLCTLKFLVFAGLVGIAIWQLIALPQHLEHINNRHLRENVLKELDERRIQQGEVLLNGKEIQLGEPPKPKKLFKQIKPFFDIVGLIFGTGRPVDVKRMYLAEQTWLRSRGNYTINLTTSWIFALCQGDPGTALCPSLGRCPSVHPNAVMLPCKSDYKRLVGKGIAGYRYIAENFDFRYVLKADVDSIMDLQCAAHMIRKIPSECKSWGMGLWRVAHDSKVFEDLDRDAFKYGNSAYKKDTGADYYPPYMTGWGMIWSGDIARFLGMAGIASEGYGAMPTWRNTWTIEDAAIGTFTVGLQMCRISMANQCSIWTEIPADGFKLRGLILNHSSISTLTDMMEVKEDDAIDDFDGPLEDDIPNLGDLANTHATSLKHCAAACYATDKCRSFEFSPTAKSHDEVKNCQLVSMKMPRARKQFRDFVLYVRRDV